MSFKNMISIESFSAVASAHAEALSENLDVLRDTQVNYMQLRQAMRRLLKCPALNTNGLEAEDQHAISGALHVMRSVTLAGASKTEGEEDCEDN